MPKRRSRGLPSRVEWEVFDPLDGFVLLRVEGPVRTIADVRRDRRMIQTAPKLLKPLGRPDGKPIGLRNLKTRTRLIYTTPNRVR